MQILRKLLSAIEVKGDESYIMANFLFFNYNTKNKGIMKHNYIYLKYVTLKAEDSIDSIIMLGN